MKRSHYIQSTCKLASRWKFAEQTHRIGGRETTPAINLHPESRQMWKSVPIVNIEWRNRWFNCPITFHGQQQIRREAADFTDLIIAFIFTFACLTSRFSGVYKLCAKGKRLWVCCELLQKAIVNCEALLECSVQPKGSYVKTTPSVSQQTPAKEFFETISNTGTIHPSNIQRIAKQELRKKPKQTFDWSSQLRF